MNIFTINKDNWKRKFAIFKFTLSRGYILCQLPLLSVIGAAVIAPYFPEVKLAYLAIIAFVTMVLAGWFDVKFNILHEEQRYMTEQNPTLMKGLFHKGDTKNKIIMAQDIIDRCDDENEN